MVVFGLLFVICPKEKWHQFPASVPPVPSTSTFARQDRYSWSSARKLLETIDQRFISSVVSDRRMLTCRLLKKCIIDQTLSSLSRSNLGILGPHNGIHPVLMSKSVWFQHLANTRFSVSSSQEAELVTRLTSVHLATKQLKCNSAPLLLFLLWSLCGSLHEKVDPCWSYELVWFYSQKWMSTKSWHLELEATAF